jgi:hypothetical protein
MKPLSNPKQKKNYLEDLQTIKDLLIEVEEKPMVESWAFFTWGFCCVVGSIGHFITERYFGFLALDLGLKVWLPVFLLGGFFETIAYIKRMNKESIPLFSKTMKKFILTFLVLIINFSVILCILIKTNAVFYLPVIIPLFIGLCFAFYAYVCATWMYYQAFFLILLSIFLFIFDIHRAYMVIVVGLGIAFSFLWGGLASLKREKK